MSCKKLWYCLPKVSEATNPYIQWSRRQSVLVVQPGHSHGHTRQLSVKQEQSENPPDDPMASKTGWKVSE